MPEWAPVNTVNEVGEKARPLCAGVSVASNMRLLRGKVDPHPKTIIVGDLSALTPRTALSRTSGRGVRSALRQGRLRGRRRGRVGKFCADIAQERIERVGRPDHARNVGELGRIAIERRRHDLEGATVGTIGHFRRVFGAEAIESDLILG